ncbi:hypothetical protein Vadar_014661 [Vaccinium darrowii]|uniref:Uncharacterized protein n=1 Tax=Vaccinium darrowii TaxID=229202 RepID=A0ACB7XHJ8_9ERIC|nr:hypothetical protein Vadar_014661 [Vaccinium darrowii]
MEMMKTSGDIEAGNKLLYRRDLYLEQALIWLLAVAIGTVVVHVPTIPKFLLTTTPGIVVYILALVAPFGVLLLFPLFRYIEHRRVNAVLLILVYVLMAFAMGLSCSFSMGVLLTSILMSVVYVTLILYTFWAAARGHDFGFMGPFLMVSLFVLIVFALIQRKRKKRKERGGFRSSKSSRHCCSSSLVLTRLQLENGSANSRNSLRWTKEPLLTVNANSKGALQPDQVVVIESSPDVRIVRAKAIYPETRTQGYKHAKPDGILDSAHCFLISIERLIHDTQSPAATRRKVSDALEVLIFAALQVCVCVAYKQNELITGLGQKSQNSKAIRVNHEDGKRREQSKKINIR